MDPFTGGGSYRPGATNATSGGAATYTDPFTGGGSYRPAGSANVAPAAAPAAAASPQQAKVLPIVSNFPWVHDMLLYTHVLPRNLT